MKKPIKKKFQKWIKLFMRYVKLKDLGMVGLFLLISNSAYIVLTLLYPTTGEPGFQWLYWLLFGITRTLIIIGVGYLTLSILMPRVFTYLEDELFKKDIETVEPWQKIKFYTFLYCFFIVIFLLSVVTMGM